MTIVVNGYPVILDWRDQDVDIFESVQMYLAVCVGCLSSRMMLRMQRLQSFPRHMRVNLCSGNIGVTQ